jgi:hypothetical protein
MLFEELLMQKRKLHDLSNEVNDRVLIDESTTELNFIRDATIDEADDHRVYDEYSMRHNNNKRNMFDSR